MDRLVRSAAAAGCRAPPFPANGFPAGRYDLIERQNVDVVRTVPLATPMIERVR